MSDNYGNNGTQNFNDVNQQNSQMQQGNQQYNQGNMYQQSDYSQQQIYMNQQMMQQQQMMNQMMQQQQQLMKSNQELARKNQQLVANNTAPTSLAQPQPTTSNIRVRNFWSLIAALILIFALAGSEFIDFGSGDYDYSISEFCEELDEDIDDWGEYMDSEAKLYSRISSFLNILTIATVIVLALGGFINVTGFRGWAIGLTMISFIIMTLYVINETDEFPFGLPFYLLIAGLIIGIKSGSTDITPEKDPVLRGLGNGVSNSSLNLSAVANGSTGYGEWRCPKCDTKNTGSLCKVCGTSRP